MTHHVALSVVGTERLPESGYFRAKLVPDPTARYVGAVLGERTLVPTGDARLGATHLDRWRE